MTAVVLGIGQSLAGDDGVGLAVARAVAARGLPSREATDASALLPLLEDGQSIVIVDAVVGGGAPGDVVHLTPASLASGPRPLSSHGLGVAEALSLAGILLGEAALKRVQIVGVVIDMPSLGSSLSPPVERAVEAAADVVEALARSA